MKKILSIAAALVVAAAFISCGDSGDSFDGKTDTVLTIGTPKVTAKAYPGANYVTWTPVSQAVSYDVYRIADGESNGTYLGNVAANKGLAKADVAQSAAPANTLVNGVTYKYVVVAVPSNNATTATVTTPTAGTVPARAIYVKANQGEASCKAIIPAAGTKIDAKEFGSYAQNYINKFYKDDAAATKNIAVVQTSTGLCASYPATAGFQYGVKFINHTQPEYINESKAPASSFSTLYLENYTANLSQAITNPGKYSVYLTMKSVSDYYPEAKVFTGAEYTIEGMNVTQHTRTFEAAYNADGSKIVLTWVPAKVDGTKVPTTNYKLYKAQVSALNDGVTLTPVEGTVAEVSKVEAAAAKNGQSVANGKDNATVDTLYSLEDAVTDNKVAYTYVLVNTDGKRYENRVKYQVKDASDNWVDDTAEGKRTVNAYTGTTVNKPHIVSAVVSQDSTKIDATIKLTVCADNHKQTLGLTWFKLDDTFDTTKAVKKTFATDSFKNTATLSKTDVDAGNNGTYGSTTALSNGTQEFQYAYVTADKPGTYLFKLTATEGTATASTYHIVKVQPAGVSTIRNVGAIAVNTEAEKAFINIYGVDAAKAGLYTYNLITIDETYSQTSSYADYITIASSSEKLEVAEKTVDNGDDYINKYAYKTGANSTTQLAKDDKLLATKALSVKYPSDPEKGFEVKRAIYVQVVANNDNSVYNYIQVLGGTGSYIKQKN